MGLRLRGSEGKSMYGYRVAATFGAWELAQDDGDDGAMVDVKGHVQDEFFKHFEPTALRLKLGDRWITYRSVELVGDDQYRVVGKSEKVHSV